MKCQKYRAALAHTMVAVSEFSLQQFNSNKLHSIVEKGYLDFATHVDREAEDMIRCLLSDRLGDVNFLGEEFGGDRRAPSYWVIDPIDGTSNFMSGLPLWGVSIAYVDKGRVILGAVSLPSLDIMLTAEHEKGIQVEGAYQAHNTAYSQLFCVGRNSLWNSNHRQQLENTLEKSGYGVVCLGSCAATLAFIALGRLSGYFEAEIKEWDCAAGVLLCREAGLYAWYKSNGHDDRCSVFAGPQTLEKIIPSEFD